ncbi:Plasmodium exported protein (PHISTa), unknown function [Plasmodium reichenowi]|uniref:Uncharacterized protein n=1 Tax=Plasmodium reichenowi TaxID=5854 RepID=A0A2P9DSZ0_PLARE|nr:Plasmodium exported protein (PHISTa), unknown function [Plasmodium reichenowi]
MYHLISVSFVHRNLSEYYIGIYAALRNYYHQPSGVYKKYYSGKLKKDICYDTLEEAVTQRQEDSDEASHDEPVNNYAKKNKQNLRYGKVDSIIKTLNNTDVNKHKLNDSNNKFKAPLRNLNYNDLQEN